MATSQSIFLSPLRYPGGKRKLTNFMKLVLIKNGLIDCDYVEPYAGGASVALGLLFDDYARRIFINDIDPAIYSFWYSVLNRTDELCDLIASTEVSMEEWYRQKVVQSSKRPSRLALGFSTFFLNRTNRSGVIQGGVIGGKAQSGEWGLDARYNVQDLIARIRRVASFRDRIVLYNKDAIEFLREVRPHLSRKALYYLDPPYYVKGTQALYKNFYEDSDHQAVQRYLARLKMHWIVSYDDVPRIQELYKDYAQIRYKLSYSAQDRYRGAEIVFSSPLLRMPDVADPSRIKPKQVHLSLFPQLL